MDEDFRLLKSLIEGLECRVKGLERALKAFRGSVKLEVEVPRVILERKPLDIRISEDELPGRIILLVKDGFFDDGKTASDVVNELIRRCWHPKDLKHVRPSLEQLTALGVLERSREKKVRGKGFKWVYRKGDLKIIEK